MDNQTVVKRPRIITESDFLRQSAERLERAKKPVLALLFRNEALRLESPDSKLTL